LNYDDNDKTQSFLLFWVDLIEVVVILNQFYLNCYVKHVWISIHGYDVIDVSNAYGYDKLKWIYFRYNYLRCYYDLTSMMEKTHVYIDVGLHQHFMHSILSQGIIICYDINDIL